MVGGKRSSVGGVGVESFVLLSKTDFSTIGGSLEMCPEFGIPSSIQKYIGDCIATRRWCNTHTVYPLSVPCQFLVCVRRVFSSPQSRSRSRDGLVCTVLLTKISTKTSYLMRKLVFNVFDISVDLVIENSPEV